MIPTLESIIKASRIHPSRVFNVYLFGSQVYSTADSKSDFDIIMVANNSVESTEIRNGLFNIHVYTPDKFKADLDWHRPNNLECIYAPDWAKLKETIKYNDFKIDTSKLRHSISHVSSNSWVKAKKKLADSEYYTGVKSLFHSIRIPMFGTQIATSGYITDFSCANFIWDRIKKEKWTWDELQSEFGKLYNETLSDFRKVAKK